MTTITAALAEWRPRDNKLQSAFEDGWEARDAMTCVWKDTGIYWEAACGGGARYQSDGQFCANCGAKIVIEEQNDERRK